MDTFRSAEEYLTKEAAHRAAQISRPKPWAELSIEEKIERIREQVKIGQTEIRYGHEVRSEMARTISRLSEHQHDVMGRVVVPFSDARSNHLQGQCCGESNLKDVDPSKVYF